MITVVYMIEITKFIILALPILLGVIISKRYNIIFGFVFVFFSASFLYFLMIESEIVALTFVESFKENSLFIALEQLNFTFVEPMDNLFFILFKQTGMGSFWDWIISNVWLHFGFIFVLNVIIHTISQMFRSRRVKALKELKKDARRY